MASLCREFGISRKTGNKIIRSSSATKNAAWRGSVTGLVGRSGMPTNCRSGVAGAESGAKYLTPAQIDCNLGGAGSASAGLGIGGGKKTLLTGLFDKRTRTLACLTGNFSRYVLTARAHRLTQSRVAGCDKPKPPPSISTSKRDFTPSLMIGLCPAADPQRIKTEKRRRLLPALLIAAKQSGHATSSGMAGGSGGLWESCDLFTLIH